MSIRKPPLLDATWLALLEDADLERPAELHDPHWAYCHDCALELLVSAIPYRPNTTVEEDLEAVQWLTHALYQRWNPLQVEYVLVQIDHDLEPLQRMVRLRDPVNH